MIWGLTLAGSYESSAKRGRVSTEVAFGRGDLSDFPLGPSKGPMNSLFSIGGVSRGVPTGTNTKGTSPLGALLCFIEEGRRRDSDAAVG